MHATRFATLFVTRERDCAYVSSKSEPGLVVWPVCSVRALSLDVGVLTSITVCALCSHTSIALGARPAASMEKERCVASVRSSIVLQGVAGSYAF